jgi:hypothetical protein
MFTSILPPPGSVSWSTHTARLWLFRTPSLTTLSLISPHLSGKVWVKGGGGIVPSSYFSCIYSNSRFLIFCLFGHNSISEGHTCGKCSVIFSSVHRLKQVITLLIFRLQKHWPPLESDICEPIIHGKRRITKIWVNGKVLCILHHMQHALFKAYTRSLIQIVIVATLLWQNASK